MKLILSIAAIIYLQFISSAISVCCSGGRGAYCGKYPGCEGYCRCCEDCTITHHAYCGVGGCNFFGCNCDGGCRTGPGRACGTRRLIEDETSDAKLSEMEIFAEVDEDMNGKISFDELKNWYNNKYDENKNENDSGYKLLLQTAFNDMDINNDGFIDYGEFDNDLKD
mmetsp:Transcript_30040/g.26528  ORF Transcript_30040/g.26528 Transcript_30040/m.26528 type:complete len:167 (-) Transcript_30040:66-566(-)